MNSTEHARKAANALWANRESRNRLMELRRNPDYKARVSISMKKRWKIRNHNISEEHKSKIGRGSKNVWNLKTQEERRLIGNKISILRKGFKFSDETKAKMSAIAKGKHRSPETEFNSERLKKLYEDPIYIQKLAQAWNLKPNKPEKLLLNLLNDLYPDEWKYTGDFSFTINGKCPDFVNCNGQKKIIELFGDYWHRGQNPKDRVDTFKPFGYDTLIIWEKELKNMVEVSNRINEFVRE